jgi:hypothetical protein
VGQERYGQGHGLRIRRIAVFVPWMPYLPYQPYLRQGAKSRRYR